MEDQAYSRKPWQRETRATSCCRCPAPPVRYVEGDGDIVFACEEHASRIAIEICDRRGGASTMIMRQTWRYWLAHRFLPTRWVGRVSIACHNARFERGLAKAERCGHGNIGTDGVCFGCGIRHCGDGLWMWGLPGTLRREPSE